MLQRSRHEIPKERGKLGVSGSSDLATDYEGTYFVNDPAASSGGLMDISLDLTPMQTYYHLCFGSEQTASISV